LAVTTEEAGHHEIATDSISVLLASARVAQTMVPSIDDTVESMGEAFCDRWVGQVAATRVNGWIVVMLYGWLK
jgi:hypothetical protein